MARSNRHQLSRGSAGRSTKAISNARRMWPYMLMAWERWQSLSPEQKERYLRQAREAADRGKQVLDKQLGKKRR